MVVRDEVVAPLQSGIPLRLVNQRLSAIDVTEDIRSLIIDTINDKDVTRGSTPRSESPGYMVTPPGISTFTMFPERKRQSSEIIIKPMTKRPRLRRKANTAPSGALQILPEGKPQFKPQLPRRAISTRTADALSRSGSRDRRRPSKTLPSKATELMKLGERAPRSLVSKKKSKRNSGGRMGLRSKPLVWRMSSPPKVFELPPELKPSFSEKDRVKETLRLKEVDMIMVNRVGCDEPRGLASSPASSIVLTPIACYERPTIMRMKTPPTPARSLTPLRGTPSRSETPRCSSPLRDATGPGDASPASSLKSSGSRRSGTLSTRAKHFSLPLSPVAQQVPWRKSIVADSTPRNTTPIPRERRRVYTPGPIQIEEKISVTPRRSSVANLERFDDGTVPQAKRFSDLVALEGITMYFEALGVCSEASQACLDRYWLRNRTNSYQVSGTSANSARKGAPGLSSMLAAPIASLPSGSIATTFEGIFRSQKALRDDERCTASSGTAGRRRPLLQQLWKSSRKSG